MNFNQQNNNFETLQNLEWIETNGIGGYASGTVSGAHSRRYHGLLVAAIHPPVDRMVVVSKLEETIVLDDERFELSTNQYPGAIHPAGFQFLSEFNRDLFPQFIFKINDIELKKTIACIDGENMCVVIYEVINAGKKFVMELLPLYACRDFHHTSHENEYIASQYLFQDDLLRSVNYQGCPEFFISVPNSKFEEKKGWYHHFEYEMERSRGLDFQEDLYTHGKFLVELQKGSKLGIIISTNDPTGKDPHRLITKEKKRRNLLVRNGKGDALKKLMLAADQFIVSRGELKTIIAGYHWFSDWGRDTMIALPGLCLTTGRFDDAKNILLTFSNSVSEGMLPNRFPDHGEHPEYNTIDATLWFFQAIYKYYKYTSDKIFIKSILSCLNQIIEWHYKGTRYNIHVDTDGLLTGGEEGVQLTWMDAKVGDWVVTPRRGKPVEINALWYNALCIMDFFYCELENPNEAHEYKMKARIVSHSFNEKFWNEQGGYLFDVIDKEFRDDSIRPNQLYAVGLPFQLLSDERAKKIFEVVKQHLFTPRGLRSLSPNHPDFKPFYIGDPWHRDGAYHQGTVWSFLMGVYIDSLVKVNRTAGKSEAATILNNFLSHLDEAGIGTVSEIFDATPPHTPRGCIAQAWGVAELLRVIVDHKIAI